MKVKILLGLFLVCTSVAWWASDYDTTCAILAGLAIVLNVGEWGK